VAAARRPGEVHKDRTVPDLRRKRLSQRALRNVKLGPGMPDPGRYQDPPISDLVDGTAQLVRLEPQRPHRHGYQAGQRSRPRHGGPSGTTNG